MMRSTWPLSFMGRRSASVTDPYFSSTVLLLSGDGANNSTTFTDESFAARGNGSRPGGSNAAKVTTTNPKFGTGAIFLNGSTDFITFPDSADFTFGTSDFTVEGWFLFAGSLTQRQPLIGHWDGTAGNRGWLLRYHGEATPDQLRFSISSNGLSGTAVDILAYNWTPTANTYYHIAVDRSGNTFRLYIDGTMVASGTNSMSIFNNTADLNIGNDWNATYYDGRIDEIRVTLGVARYATNGSFTVPASPFPRS